MVMRKNQIEAYITDFECYGDTGKGKDENIKSVQDMLKLGWLDKTCESDTVLKELIDIKTKNTFFHRSPRIVTFS